VVEVADGAADEDGSEPLEVDRRGGEPGLERQVGELAPDHTRRPVPAPGLALGAPNLAAALGARVVLALAAALLPAPGVEPCRMMLARRDRSEAWTAAGREAFDRRPLPAGALPASVWRRIERRPGKSSDRKRVR
jgi:hypothetical protein